MQTATTPQPTQRVIDITAAAKILSVSTFSVRELIKDKKIGAVRIGRLLRIPISALDEFLASGAASADDRPRKLA